MSVDYRIQYLQELEDSKNDYYLYTHTGLRVTLSHIISSHNLPTDNNAYWVFQHWQALPKPIAPYPDFREFGYFIFRGGVLDYRTFPAETLVIESGVTIIPIQYRKPATPNRIPVAGNYFPNATISFIDGRYTLHTIHTTEGKK